MHKLSLSRTFFRRLALLLAALAAPELARADSPRPGQYSIESEVLISQGLGLGAFEQRTRKDSAGTLTYTVRWQAFSSASDPTLGAPMTSCIVGKATVDAAQAVPQICADVLGAALIGVGCRSKAASSTFRRLDDRTWQHEMSFKPPDERHRLHNVRRLAVVASRDLPQAERTRTAETLAKLAFIPMTDSDLGEAEAKLRRFVESKLASLTPADAASVRWLLQASAAANGPSLPQTQSIKETWTRVAADCQAQPANGSAPR